MAVVLIVDDHVGMAHAVAELVQELGCEATIANGGREALDVLRQRHFDLVVLDLNMPGVSGMDVLRSLREKAKTEVLPPVYVYSASEEGREASLKMGAAGFIAKADAGELIPIIERRLGCAGV